MTRTKKKTDPKLTTPNAYLQHILGEAVGSRNTLKERQFESLVSEQIRQATGTPAKFIRKQRDGDGYLRLEDIKFPMPLAVNLRRPTSWEEVTKSSISELCKPTVMTEERMLAVLPWRGSGGMYAQFGIFKSPEDELQGFIEGPLVKRGHDGHVYYLGRLFDVLKAMVTVGLLPRFDPEIENAYE